MIGQCTPKSLHKGQIDRERLIQTVYVDARKLETLNESLITFAGTSAFLSYDLTAKTFDVWIFYDTCIIENSFCLQK